MARSISFPLSFIKGVKCGISDLSIDGQDTGLCYAFVEFEDVLSARNAIKV